MSKWQKLLDQMANDPNPIGYTYDEAAGVLGRLGFTLASRSHGSHRKWARKVGKVGVVIGLIDSGKGTLKPYLIRDMVRQLREHNLIT